jgi:hypothetical protein
MARQFLSIESERFAFSTAFFAEKGNFLFMLNSGCIYNTDPLAAKRVFSVIN